MRCSWYKVVGGWKNLSIKRKNLAFKFGENPPSHVEKLKIAQDQLIKNLLTQWETEKENQKIVNKILIKNLLTQWETEEENRLRKGT